MISVRALGYAVTSVNVPVQLSGLNLGVLSSMRKMRLEPAAATLMREIFASGVRPAACAMVGAKAIAKNASEMIVLAIVFIGAFISVYDLMLDLFQVEAHDCTRRVYEARTMFR